LDADEKVLVSVLVFAAILIALLLIGFVGGAVLTTLTSWQCDRVAEVNTELDFHWSLGTGCMVKMPDGVWYSTSSVRYVGLEEP
jgi:hypothetical protein